MILPTLPLSSMGIKELFYHFLRINLIVIWNNRAGYKLFILDRNAEYIYEQDWALNNP